MAGSNEQRRIWRLATPAFAAAVGMAGLTTMSASPAVARSATSSISHHRLFRLSHPWPAPVGHRQPHEWELPPWVRRSERLGDPAMREFDRRLRICKDC
jgi:hypothetical protein